MADKILATEIYPYVEKAFSDKANIKKFENIVASFIDKNHETLSAIGPTKIILFTDYEKNFIYDLIGVTPKQVKDAKNKSKDIKTEGRNMADPFKCLMTMIIRYFSIKGMVETTRLAVFYVGCALYPSLFTKYWRFPPNEKVMEYTINNLSNKYKIKQLGNLMAALDDLAYGAYVLHKEKIDAGLDSGVVLFILSIQARMNSFLKQISNEWYKNYQSGKYLESEFESIDGDNFREAESSMHVINQIVDKVSLKLVIEGPPMKIVTLSAKNNQVSVNELRNYLNLMIVNDNIDEIKKVIESILVLFLYDEHNTSRDINSDKFLIYCLDTYKRSNTTNKNIVEIKEILDSWLERLDIYKKTQRTATINSFRRALYMFFVMTIQYYNTR